MKSVFLRLTGPFRKVFKNVYERKEYIRRRAHLVPESKKRMAICVQYGSNVCERFERRVDSRLGLPPFQNRVRKTAFGVKIYHKVKDRTGNGRIPQRKMFRKDRLQSVPRPRRYQMINRFSESEYAKSNRWMFYKNHTVTNKNPCQYRISKENYEKFNSYVLFDMLKDPTILKDKRLIEYFPELENKMCKDGFLGHYDYYVLKYCDDKELIDEVVSKWTEHD